ncbi:metallophosphoesterase [Oceanihabitans sp. 2_MG-2023]|uniref:metallophosphoesterase n=1 Tax=Oceanihabitans sp. 2_MG-2023 TaxID=3062661 RepID=UPI0026E3860C|nr:metallophosphoesterase [Oceanihabitans sp. 2_MG-2023]MDO6598133.1 metallophosphoesterase [Oceanihabitans sp. 2_MG-2023]
MTKSFAQTNPFPKAQQKDNVTKSNHPTKKEKIISFNGNDGPYIINDSIYYINKENKLTARSFFKRDSILVRVNNVEEDAFFVTLEKEYTLPKTIYSLPEKMIVISDIEGNYNAFASFLIANNVIDKNHNWIFNDGHLVLGGDFVDRGINVTQVLWLIYKLEHQAKKQNGAVHFILGNHEILNFQGDHRYNRGKYIKAAQDISKLKDPKEATKFMYSKKSELGKWLATKNVIEKIGNYLFVHAGLSPEILKYRLTLDEINKITRLKYYALTDKENETVKFLYSSHAPFWYRGLITNRIKYDKIRAFELQKILKHYNSKKIIIGHTTVKDISTDFDGTVIRTDVHHGKLKFSGKTKGLLIKKDTIFSIDDTKIKKLLPNSL